jgi:hypothetical protein
MKRVLYWIGLLTIAGLVLMPDVRISPLASDSQVQVLAQGSSAEQTASDQQYRQPDLTEADLISQGCRLDGIVGKDLPYREGYTQPTGTKMYECRPPDSTESSRYTCPDHAYVYPDGRVEKVETKCGYGEARIREPNEDPQGGQQDGGQHQDSGQQGANSRGYGCAARV